MGILASEQSGPSLERAAEDVGLAQATGERIAESTHKAQAIQRRFDNAGRDGFNAEL